MGDYFLEYHSCGAEFREAITFRDFCKLNGNKMPKGQSGGNYTQVTKLQRTIGRLLFPSFDGSSKSSSRAWVEKLDVYFQLNQIVEGDAIKIAATFGGGSP